MYNNAVAADVNVLTSNISKYAVTNNKDIAVVYDKVIQMNPTPGTITAGANPTYTRAGLYPTRTIRVNLKFKRSWTKYVGNNGLPDNIVENAFFIGWFQEQPLINENEVATRGFLRVNFWR